MRFLTVYFVLLHFLRFDACVSDSNEKRVCRSGLELQDGVAEHHLECFDDRLPVRTEKMFVVGAQKSSPLFAYLIRDGMLRWRQIWRSMTQV